ncbi:hypothetical protein GJAV_G00053050 [Gymnothorax javanicus]|nr:hypothetical protein GJAV_G00053050 [Gymnothorax javanicus]
MVLPQGVSTLPSRDPGSAGSGCQYSCGAPLQLVVPRAATGVRQTPGGGQKGRQSRGKVCKGVCMPNEVTQGSGPRTAVRTTAHLNSQDQGERRIPVLCPHQLKAIPNHLGKHLSRSSAHTKGVAFLQEGRGTRQHGEGEKKEAQKDPAIHDGQ